MKKCIRRFFDAEEGCCRLYQCQKSCVLTFCVSNYFTGVGAEVFDRVLPNHAKVGQVSSIYGIKPDRKFII